jgi:hypothetical protein
MNADRSAGAHTRHVRARALAAYHAQNPQSREGGKLQNVDSSIITIRREGAEAYTKPQIGAPNLIDEGCCEPINTVIVAAVSCPSQITNFLPGNRLDIFTFPDGGDGSPGDPYYFNVSWDAVPNATSYTITSLPYDPNVSPDPIVPTPTPVDVIQYTGATTAKIITYYSDDSNVFRIFTLTATIPSCPDISSTYGVAPCFLAGSLVTLADETTIPIEDVKVGMALLGAFGEINIVKALHRPLLGNNTMTKINDEHSTSSHHPHISADKQFYAAKPAVVDNNTYGKYHTVIDKDGNQTEAFLDGLRPGRTQLLKTGIVLKTADGSRVVQTVENYELPPETQLYNLVMGGSHTYHVDGYAVTGWPSEKDFDYDTWSPK